LLVEESARKYLERVVHNLGALAVAANAKLNIRVLYHCSFDELPYVYQQRELMGFIES
jgi:hypothetical protein